MASFHNQFVTVTKPKPSESEISKTTKMAGRMDKFVKKIHHS